MNRLLLFVALFASLSATAARPTTEEILAENNFQIVSDLYQERPIWVKTYHCDSATAIRTLMMNPQIIKTLCVLVHQIYLFYILTFYTSIYL